MIENLIGKRYAEALSSSVKEDSLLNPVLGNLQAFKSALDTQDQLVRFFSQPSIPLEKKNSMVKDLCDRLKVEQVVCNLLVMLSDRKKILFVENIA
jgi:F0F1-type ATP synthase delta subunit